MMKPYSQLQDEKMLRALDGPATLRTAEGDIPLDEDLRCVLADALRQRIVAGRSSSSVLEDEFWKVK